MKNLKTYLRFFVVFVFFILHHDCVAQNMVSTDSRTNAVSLFSGAYMRKYPPSYEKSNLQGVVQRYSPEALVDGTTEKIWCSAEGSVSSLTFEIELIETYVISEFEFSNLVETNPRGMCAKDVVVEIAPTLKGNFRKVLETKLEEYENSKFSIEPTEARVVRLTIKSNFGNKDYTELAEFKAWGEPKNKNIATININGIWESNWGKVDFKQNGTLVSGHYEFNQGKIRFGGIQRNRVTYTWIEDVVQQSGNTIMFLNEEGDRLIGVWSFGNDWSNYGFWIIERDNGIPFKPISETVTDETLSQKDTLKMDDVKKDDAIVEEMKKELTSKKKITLYGVNFKKNSAEILQESLPVLQQVLEVLKSSSNINIRIEGHTDNVGSAEYNLKLSRERADAVKEFLIKNGIEQNRISIIGKGEEFPIADNETEIGRSLNRRVEIHVVE
ncbi:MAG: OmpA family protein [Ignavibacteria bacterium]|nr:OmpA family protein [Ignavibacteria bacterium]MDH7527552.1 OmpA family protein [Ignavibacteria bacterium]